MSPGNPFLESKGQRSKVNVTSHKNIAAADLYTLVSAGFFFISLTFTAFYTHVSKVIARQW